MKMSKLLALLLCAAMLLAFAAGCGNSAADEPAADEPAADAPAADEPAADAPAADEPAEIFPLAETYTFTIYHTISDSLRAEIETLNDLAWAKAMEAATNVHLDFIDPGSNAAATEQFKVHVAGGEYYDLYFDPHTSFSGGVSQAIEEGLIIEMTDLVAEYMPNYMNLRETEEDFRKAATMPEGGYGVIFGYYVSDYPPDVGLWMRQDLLTELDMEVPETYDELHDALFAMKTEFGLDTPLLMSMYGFLGNYLSAGYDVASFTGVTNLPPYTVVDGEIQFGPCEDGFKEYVRMLAQWYEEGILDPDFMTNEMFMFPDPGKTDEFGLTSIPVNIISRYTDASADEDYELVGVGTFTREAGQETHLRMSSDRFFDEGLGISTQCSNPELAAQYIDFWYSDEGFKILNYGIEGETYTIDENGKCQYTEAVFAREDLTVETAILLIANQRGSFIVDWDRQSVIYNDVQIAARELWMNLDNSYAIPSYVEMTADEAAEYSLMYSEISTLVSENVNKFIVGQQNFEEDWDRFQQTLLDMGVEDCIALWQAAYDRAMAL